MTQSMTDPYAVLGIARDATDNQVRQAYRRLAKRHHPDLHPDAPTAERMRRINQAWHTLSTPIRRARYEANASRRGPSSARPAWGSWDSAADASRYASTAPGGPSAAQPRPDEQADDGPGPIAIVAFAALLLTFGIIGAGVLPLPLLGIFLFLAGRSIFTRG